MASFTINSREGLPIRGDFDVPRDPRALVVIVHGFKGFKDWGFFPWLADYLCGQQFVACRFNMSRNGIGEEPESFTRLDLFAGDTYSGQVRDLADVVALARASFPALPLFLVGHSRGGGVALIASQEIGDLRGVVTWSAISHADRWDEATKRSWRDRGYVDVLNARTGQTMQMSTAILDDYETHSSRLDILGAAARLAAPLLVVHGGSDESVPAEEAHQIVSSNGEGCLLTIDSATHTYNAIHPLVHVPKELEYAAAVTASFIAAWSRSR
ncbi:MAG: alpha/beta hydrolase [Thermoanaerobaculia bacterium]|nr:alpha/beta hydrolase [Thermoanaerobaculia bacterium]